MMLEASAVSLVDLVPDLPSCSVYSAAVVTSENVHTQSLQPFKSSCSCRNKKAEVSRETTPSEASGIKRTDMAQHGNVAAALVKRIRSNLG